MILGAMLGFVAPAALVDRPTALLMVVTAMLGAVVAVAIAQATRL